MKDAGLRHNAVFYFCSRVLLLFSAVMENEKEKEFKESRWLFGRDRSAADSLQLRATDSLKKRMYKGTKNKNQGINRKVCIRERG